MLNFATNFDFINFKRKTKEIHINLFGKTTFFQYTYFDFTNLLSMFLHFTADGDMAKSFIMTNEDVLKKITNYMMHTNTKLQMAAVVCIYNLAFVEEPGAGERQARLKEVGVHKILGKLLTTPDPTLCEK